jgi:ABC-type uncharacterized transport system fused permease/ATPase subunit
VPAQLLDVFGFLSVLLRGGALSLNSLVLGGILLGDISKAAYLMQSFDRNTPLPEERLGLLWRGWLTGRLVGTYLGERTYYHLNAASALQNTAAISQASVPSSAPRGSPRCARLAKSRK